ncbi:MAG TPA: hypothetical protein PKA64_06030 [Myxococcota bacterium]|nr:hypothetical protein [Myxococcota bacterium]
MRFDVASSALHDAKLQRRFSSLLDRCDQGVHDARVDAEVDSTALFAAMSAADQEYLRFLATASAWSTEPPGRAFAVLAPRDVEIACKLAWTPLSVLVEDAKTDGAFISAIVALYGEPSVQRVWALTSCSPPAWRFEHGGGSSTLAALQRLIAAAAQESRPPRVVVLIDSDRHQPDVEETDLKREVRALSQVCKGALIPFVRLEKREVENYLPDSFWRAWVDRDRNRTARRAVIDALLRLDPRQRDHLDLEGDRRLLDPPPWLATIAEIDRMTLRGANLKQAHWDETANMRAFTVLDLPRAVRDGEVTSADVDARDPSGELRALVRVLTEEL